MKKIFAGLVYILSICGFAFAQHSFPELEIAKEIKLLKSTQSEVKVIMSEFDFDEEDEDYMQEFRSDDALVRVFYSMGECSEDDEFGSLFEWNVPEMTATKIVISLYETTKLEDLELNLSDFKKKLEGEDKDSEEYIYYDEKEGIIILTDEGEVEKIILHPPKKQIGSLCDSEIKSKILSKKTGLVDSILSNDPVCYLRNRPSDVTDLELQPKGVFGCEGNDCSEAKKEISVTTTAVDSENDVLTYNYTVTGGEINGSGASVIWNLTGVQPGVYGIVAGSDDGCGVCGRTKSQKILVKENSYEIVPPAKIKELKLDKAELIAGCPVGRLQRVYCPTGSCEVSVSSIAATSDDKNITYEYNNFGGKIVGSGNRVIWDLAGLPPGEYSISVAASDDGTVFGNTETALIEIKENPGCSVPK